MNLELDVGLVVGLLIPIVGAIFALMKLFFFQFEKRLDERWKIVEQARAEAMRQWEDIFKQHIAREEVEFQTMRNFEQQFMNFATSLPTLYIRRDEMKDYLVRLDMKFEGINEKLTTLTQQGHSDHDHPASF